MNYCTKCGDPIEHGELYCNKCGNFLGAVNTNTMDSRSIVPNKKNNIKQTIIGSLIGVIAIFVLSNIILNNSKGDYYFNRDPHGSGEIVENPQNGTTTNTSTRSKYRTVIVYDNTYSGMSIKDTGDAYNLISKDSIDQKNNCPSDILAIENEIINNYGITAVNLCEMDPAFARELGNVFKTIYEEYDGARGYITNLTLVNGTISDSYIAAFMPIFSFATSDTITTYPWVIKTQVLLNTAYFLNRERLQASVTSGSTSGHFPKNSTIYSPVAHELGHYLSFLAMMKSYDMSSIVLVDNSNITSLYKVYDDFKDGKYSLDMINDAYNRYKNDTNDTITLDDWRGTISGYALAKDENGEYIYDETIAESFHDVYLNKENASVASKYVVNVLKERLSR